MIEKICPKCRVPMTGDRCIKPDCGCNTEVSTTIYWCDDCNIPIFENRCPICGRDGGYVTTDIRPVFPEENMLVSILLTDDLFRYQKCSMWFGSNVYIVDGNKVKLSVAKYNSLPIDKIHEIRRRFNENVRSVSYEYFDEYVRRFIAANKDRYNYITEEAVSFVQQYLEKYDVEDMMVCVCGFFAAKKTACESKRIEKQHYQKWNESEAALRHNLILG